MTPNARGSRATQRAEYRTAANEARAELDRFSKDDLDEDAAADLTDPVEGTLCKGRNRVEVGRQGAAFATVELLTATTRRAPPLS